MARSVSKRQSPKPSRRKPAPKKGEARPLPDPALWYKLGDWPFPVQVASILKAEESGEVVGIGLYLRVPLPWEEYLVPWPKDDTAV